MKVLAVLYPGGTEMENKEILGCAENGLGLREWLQSQDHEFVSISDTGEEFDRHLKDADVVIATPFWPVYVMEERLRPTNSPNLKMLLTAGVGSDHFDLAAAARRGITVAEVTGSNVVSVAEHTVMQILILVRNFLPQYNDVVAGGWNIAEDVTRSHDIEHKTVGIVGAGRIGQRVARRLRGFDVTSLYYDVGGRIPAEVERECSMEQREFADLLRESDVVTIHCPLTPATLGLFNREVFAQMKRGAYLVNTARGAIVERDDLVEALNSGQLAGYAGDVWYPQPAPNDHPWRKMPNHAMTPHTSGTTLEAQARYAAGIREHLERLFRGEAPREEHLIVYGGEVFSPSYKYAY